MAIDVSNTPDMYKITASGSFTFNTSCRVRNTPNMSDSGVATYTSGMTVSYDSKLKNGNHLWLSYIATSGTRRYIPYANTDTGVYFGTDTNSVNPIKAATSGSGSTGTGTTTGALGSLTGQTGANVADQTPDGTILAMSGSFTFSEAARGRDKTSMTTANKVDSFAIGETVYYNAKVKADGHYWFRYIHTSGATYYVPYATIAPFRYYGTDSKPGDPVYSQSSTTGGNTGDSSTSRTQGGQDTGVPNFQSNGSASFSIDNDTMLVNGFATLTDNGAWTRNTPLMSAANITHYAKGSKVKYVKKIHADSRIWVVLSNGQYLPIGKLSTPISETQKYQDSSIPSYHSKFSYTIDSNVHQPWASIWPYTANDTNNDDRNNSLLYENPKQELIPTTTEQNELSLVKNQVDAISTSDAVTIGFMTDTHFSSFKTPSTARTLRQMKTMSYYAKNYGLDLMIHGGDLNDGAEEKKYELDDVKRAMDALKLGHRPLLVAQGNHDDNSGFARDFDGYYPRNIITNSEAYPYRFGNFANLLDTKGNTANQATYGKYKIPNSKINVILLDGFDQSDNYSSPITARRDFRHGWTHFSQTQQNWLRSTLNTIPNDELVLVVTHIMLHGVNFHTPNTFAEAKLSGSYAPGVVESGNIRQILVDYNNRTNNLVAVLGGHTHVDDYSSDYGINWIVSTCAVSDRGDGQGSRPIGSVNEQAWDTFVIDPSTRKLHRVRYGWHNNSYFSSSYSF
ncbi:cell wall hydrolase [Levilactobacillus brevis]|uniref:Cell wall hydrolase n=1 Tax=Levilactobacillus brevis TaxID=1580 RepID=A0A5B7Y2X6_LEVBR|nr:SH3 domain-containing protein [Levilactobacillus brevis]KIO94215.1 hypothetical protein N624_0329 [Levilactobacillus brevis]QCZ54368.1 cell wall hydrolase [Levilactobacillus brevis]